MTRKEKKKNKEVEKINKILRTFPDEYPSYVLKKKCPRCLQLNYKEYYFCAVCNFDIHKVKVERINRKV